MIDWKAKLVRADEPQEKVKCPACQQERCVGGTILASNEGAQFKGAFYPDGLRFFAFKRMVRLQQKQRFYACPDCGHMWSEINAVDLHALLETNEKRANSTAGVVWALPPRVKAALLIVLLVALMAGVIGISKMVGV